MKKVIMNTSIQARRTMMTTKMMEKKMKKKKKKKKVCLSVGSLKFLYIINSTSQGAVL